MLVPSGRFDRNSTFDGDEGFRSRRSCRRVVSGFKILDD